MKAIIVPGRPDWIAVTLGNDERFLTVAEAEELRDALGAVVVEARQAIADALAQRRAKDTACA